MAIDLETTGLSPRTDRVVEVAVIQLDCDLSPRGELATLVNPGRDIGPIHIHHITARDVVRAPRFEQIAPMLLDALHGRIVVAHNVQFDLSFCEPSSHAWVSACPSCPPCARCSLHRSTYLVCRAGHWPPDAPLRVSHWTEHTLPPWTPGRWPCCCPATAAQTTS